MQHIKKPEELEKKERQIIRSSNLQKTLLSIVGGVGLLGVALLAPNALHALRSFGLDKKLKKQHLSVIARAKRNLIEKGLLLVANTVHGKVLRLSPKGQRVLNRIRFQSHLCNKQKTWDKKWRVIIFDISEKRRATRDALRQNLILAGFCKIQNSVWVHPYPCEELISLLKADLKIGKDVLYMIVDQLEGDKHIRQHFNLPLTD